MRKFFDWLDHRTGYRRLRDTLLLEHIPGGAKWRYVWGSTLAFVFMLQLVTGVLLMTAYSASDEDAWGSVYYIQYEMDFGWLIRGLHHFGSQTMVVLMGLHMLQVVIAGAHLPPREINWWLGLVLMGIVLGLSLTGYLLPWDQKGYYATQVATNIIGHMPLLGPFIQKVLVGGPEYGNQTLTHFYALHVGILPPTLILFLILHLAAFRRHGITAPKDAKGEGLFWPDQAFRDLVVCLIIFAIMLGLVVFAGHGNPIAEPGEEQSFYDTWAKAGRNGWGANLDAPADRLTSEYPARPEWYFLFLFQLLKYFQGDQEIIGTLVIPGLVGALLFIVPLLGYGRMRRFGHVFGVVVVSALVVAVGGLTLLAIGDDSADPMFFGLLGGSDKAKEYRKRLHHAEEEAKIAVKSAADGIPSEGARFVMRSNPLTAGKKLFKMHCATCHAYDFGEPAEEGKKEDKKSEPKASDLTGFASAPWIRGLLENPSDPKYLGRYKSLTEMKDWREGINEEREGMSDAKKKEQDAQLDEIAWFVAEQKLDPDERKERLTNDQEFAKRWELAKATYKTYGCQSCHNIDDVVPGAKKGPDLTGYGSQGWIHVMVLAPAHRSRYADTVDRKGKVNVRNAMPAFRPPADTAAGKHLEKEFEELYPNFDRKGIIALSDYERELLVRYMTRDPRVVFGGQPVAGPPKRKK